MAAISIFIPAILAIILGLLVLIWPKILNVAVGLWLLIYGIVQVAANL